MDLLCVNGFGDLVDFSTRECEGLGGGGGDAGAQADRLKQVLDVNT